MSLVLRRTYIKAKHNLLASNNVNNPLKFIGCGPKNFSDDKSGNKPQYINSTILVENGFNVQELPVIVRKLNDLTDIENKPDNEAVSTTPDSHNYKLIQEEFNQCMDLRDVFSLLSKCTKITPNIALGAIERIYDIEKNPSPLIAKGPVDTKIMHINLAKGAILDKLLRVVLKTEDTQTILNILNTVSLFMEPYKYKFCDELLLRVIDEKLSIEELCKFMKFLIKNKADPKYSDAADNLWVGFVAKETHINENNIMMVFEVVHGLKASKKIILTLLEQKLCDLWRQINIPIMQDILNTFMQEKYMSLQSFAVVGSWLHANIHALDEDTLLDIISKLTRLKYSDDQVEKSVQKYMKLKGKKISSHVLVVGILNYCMQFQIRNKLILNSCCEYFVSNWKQVPNSFLKSYIYPFGYLYYNPSNSSEFWNLTEKILNEKLDKISTDDLCSIVLSLIYIEKYPLFVVNKMFSAEYLVKMNSQTSLKKLKLIDTALSLECKDYVGPMLPKDQCPKPVAQDFRIKNILCKIKDCLVSVARGDDKVSTAVAIPYLHADETYLLDAMIHPSGLGSNTFNWKLKCLPNENIAILIHLPDHYCSDNEQLIGSQMMKKRHLKLLGMRVVSLKYSLLSQFYTSYNKNGLREYLLDSITNVEAL